LKQNEISAFVAEKYGVESRAASVIGKNMEGSSMRGLIDVAGLVDNLNDPHEWLEYYKMLVEKKKDSDDL